MSDFVVQPAVAFSFTHRYAAVCTDAVGSRYHSIRFYHVSLADCFHKCDSLDHTDQKGLSYISVLESICDCHYEDDKIPGDRNGGEVLEFQGTGPIGSSSRDSSGWQCYERDNSDIIASLEVRVINYCYPKL